MKEITEMRTYLSNVFEVSLVTIIFFMSISDMLAQKSGDEQTSKVVLMSEVTWEHLNPARGDQSPKAATLWGNRNGTEATGFLAKFNDGFSSPPHIHNVTYRALVISGLIHNDDPNAAEMWMPSGSFWTQPAGESHITAAKGIENIAYVEIDRGPYLVKPIDESFDKGEKPVNLDKSNIIWLDASNITWINQSKTSVAENGPKLAFLWGNPQDSQLNGTLLKLPAGFTGKIISRGSIFRAVVIQGQPQYHLSENDIKSLKPGSYFSGEGESVHQITTESGEESIIYVRMDGKYEVIPTQPKN